MWGGARRGDRGVDCPKHPGRPPTRGDPPPGEHRSQQSMVPQQRPWTLLQLCGGDGHPQHSPRHSSLGSSPGAGSVGVADPQLGVCQYMLGPRVGAHTCAQVIATHSAAVAVWLFPVVPFWALLLKLLCSTSWRRPAFSRAAATLYTSGLRLPKAARK